MWLIINFDVKSYLKFDLKSDLKFNVKFDLKSILMTSNSALRSL